MKKGNVQKMAKGCFSCMIVILCLIFLIDHIHALDRAKSTDNLSKTGYTDSIGYMYFNIQGGPSGNSLIKLKFEHSIMKYATFRDSPSTWKVSIDGSTNRHKVRFSNGSQSIQLTTVKDGDGAYFIFNIPIVYDMPAHYQYYSWDRDIYENVSVGRMSFENYGTSTNSASASGRHSTSTTARSINIQANSLWCGVRGQGTGGSKCYNGVIGFSIAKATRTVKFTNGLGTTLKTQTITDGSTASAPANPSRTGYTFAGWDKSFSAICANTTVNAKWNINTYTNTINHWAGGFKNNEGNNGAKNMFNIANTSFSAAYNSVYTMNSSRAATIPKGFYLASTFGTSSISGSWGSYAMGTNVTQKPNSMFFEYDYVPYSYSITYNLDGGTNSSLNPNSYTVLYGVTLQNPTRNGYTFQGWYNGNTKVTGINQNANATFSSASDMYSKLNSRSIGNITLTARWKAFPVINTPVINNPDNNEIHPFIDNGKLIIQLGDTFNAIKYATAIDADKNDITANIKVIANNVPLKDLKAYQSGEYQVTYRAVDKWGGTSTKILKVIVNDPPEIRSTTRYFLKNQDVSDEELLKKVFSVDLEDGNISDRVKILNIRYMDDSVANNPDHLNTDKEGECSATLQVTDSYRKTVQSQMIIKIAKDTIIENQLYSRYSRGIHFSSIATLSEKSIWKLDPAYEASLSNALQKNNASKIIEYTGNDIQEIQNDIKNKKSGEQANREFAEKYLR